MSRVSVVIPALNDGAMLRQCLAALAVQSRPADEIVVVDNGSTDDTAQIAREAGARVVAGALPGILPSTATGFDAANGDILARLDADSIPPVDWIADVAAAFEASPALDILTGPGDFYGGNALVHWIARHVYIGGYIWFIGLVLGHPPLFGSNLAMRSTAWARLRLVVHRDVPDIHDDLEISIHVPPDMSVRFEPRLVVGVSARPFAAWSGFARRIRWAYTTLSLNWRERSILGRRAERRRWERAHGQSGLR